MSHITTIDIEITDLDALEAAVREMGAQFLRGQTSYTWFGRSIGDYPIPRGFTAADLGKCDHVIRLPGCQYEIGVVKNPAKPTTYTLLYDFWGPGKKLKAHFGANMERIKQLYAVHRATTAARAKGYSVRRITKTDGTINLAVSVPF